MENIEMSNSYVDHVKGAKNQNNVYLDYEMDDENIIFKTQTNDCKYVISRKKAKKLIFDTLGFSGVSDIKMIQ